MIKVDAVLFLQLKDEYTSAIINRGEFSTLTLLTPDAWIVEDLFQEKAMAQAESSWRDSHQDGPKLSLDTVS